MKYLQYISIFRHNVINLTLNRLDYNLVPLKSYVFLSYR